MNSKSFNLKNNQNKDMAQSEPPSQTIKEYFAPIWFWFKRSHATRSFPPKDESKRASGTKHKVFKSDVVKLSNACFHMFNESLDVFVWEFGVNIQLYLHLVIKIFLRAAKYTICNLYQGPE